MEQLIIEDNYNKWFRKIANNFDENILMSYNWKDIFKKLEHILKSHMSDFQIRLEVFAFLNRYFNNIFQVIVDYTTASNVR